MTRRFTDRSAWRELPDSAAPARRVTSNRFLTPEESGRRGTPRPRRGEPAGGITQLFAEGQWQMIRVQLEGEGWDPSQIDLMRDQLRQGWSLAVARRTVARLTGRCPVNGRPCR
jgi:hypothetical protein